MIDAIDEMCRVWGAQKSAMLRGENQGWPGESILAKFRDSQYDQKSEPVLRQKQLTAKGRQTFTPRPIQFTEEGHTGEGLMVARALADAPEALRAIVFVHYVILAPFGQRSPAKYKARVLGLSVAEYWRYLDRAHYWIAARVPRTAET